MCGVDEWKLIKTETQNECSDRILNLILDLGFFFFGVRDLGWCLVPCKQTMDERGSTVGVGMYIYYF